MRGIRSEKLSGFPTTWTHGSLKTTSCLPLAWVANESPSTVRNFTSDEQVWLALWENLQCIWVGKGGNLPDKSSTPCRAFPACGSLAQISANPYHYWKKQVWSSLLHFKQGNWGTDGWSQPPALPCYVATHESGSSESWSPPCHTFPLPLLNRSLPGSESGPPIFPAWSWISFRPQEIQVCPG